MALNKRKVLDAARKLAQKGAKQKALKEYEKLLAADPRDAKLHLEVGDAYRRWGQVEEAISQYTRVANQFRQDGFDARAVAVYKQILNLDPKRYATFVSLGELYQHMGLDAEAIGALQTAADGYHKEGDKRKALELLRKMAALDPSNTTSRMKVADLLKQEGMAKDAVAEYREVAAELKRQGAKENVPTVLERILEIEPESVTALTSLADCYMDLSRADRAEPFAVRVAQIQADTESHERLCNIYRALGNDEKLADATRSLARLYRDRGDEDQAREIMQRLPTEAVVETGGLGRDQSEVEEPVLSDEEVLDDDEFLLGDDDADLELTDESPAPLPPAPSRAPSRASSRTPSRAPESSNEDSSAALPIAEGDPDQLFAEASVYLRYGKTAQAIASLKGILVQQPDHRGALEKLGEAMIEKGEEAGAVANWRRAAELAAEAGDAAALDLLRDRITAIDPSAASQLPEIETRAASDAAAAGDDDLDIELDLDLSGDEPAPQEDGDDATDGFDLDLGEGGEGLDVAIGAASAGADASGDSHDGGFSLDLDADDDLASAMAEASAAAGSDGAEARTGGDAMDGGFEIDLDADDLGIEVEIDGADAGPALRRADADAGEDAPGLDLGGDDLGADLDVDVDTEAGAANAPSESANGHSTTTAARIKEELEEAEFYLQQDLFSEAEAIYRRILEVAPGHPSALLRLGELAARKGRDPAALDAPSPGDSDDASLEFGLSDDDATDRATGESSDDEDFEVDVDFGDQTEDSTEVAMLDESTLGGSPASNPLLSEEMAEAALGSALGEQAPELDVDDTFGSDDAPAAETPRPLAAASDDDSFDLAAELAGAFEDANAPAATATEAADETDEVLSKVDDGFESIFSDFKKGVSAALEEGDYETRYDLGIAYREMGLYEDAIAEFRVCLDSANRRLESLHMMGLSAYDLGRYADAVHHLEQALSTPELAENRKVGIYFDLGRAHEASGDLGRAEGVYLEVEALDASFPGLRARLESVRSGGGGEPLQLASEGEFESFRDLFSGDDDEPEPADEPAGEVFENFDDVITDVEAEIGRSEAIDEELEVDAVFEAEPEPEDAAPAPEDELPTDPGASGRRKKKISFV